MQTRTYNNTIVLLSPKSRTHGTLDLKFYSPYFTLGRQVVKATWRTVHLPCLCLWTGTHGWGLLLILGLCPSRATSFESWSYVISVVCPGSRVLIFAVTQGHTCEASSSHRVNASSFPWHPSFSWVESKRLHNAESLLFSMLNFLNWKEI